jgi:RNA polymerase sigma-70 factor (ECF subfamily)
LKTLQKDSPVGDERNKRNRNTEVREREFMEASAMASMKSARESIFTKAVSQNSHRDTLKNSSRCTKSVAGEELSEADAIRKAQLGDESMFEYLYHLHSRRVYAICLRMLGDSVEAEDLTQEVFLLLFRKIQTFRGESAFSTWLHRLAVNLVLMRLRKRSLPTVSIETTHDPHDESCTATIDLGKPDLSLEGTLDRIMLERCMEQLPVGYRTIFFLHDIQGYEHREIAKIKGRSTGVSKSQLHKARTRLRALLHQNQRDLARAGRRAAAKTRLRSVAILPWHSNKTKRVDSLRSRTIPFDR